MGATLKMKECDTMRILVVEDDRLLNNTLCYNLKDVYKRQLYHFGIKAVIIPKYHGDTN